MSVTGNSNASGLAGAGVESGSLVSNTGAASAELAALSAPIAPNIAHSRRDFPKILGRLSKWRTVADLPVTSGVASDTATTDPLYGDISTALRFTYDGTSRTCWGATTSAKSVVGRILRLTWRIVTKPTSFPTTFELRLYSSGSPTSPASSYTSYSLKEGGYSQAITGRWWAYHIPADAGTAVSGGANLSAITYVSIAATHDGVFEYGTLDIVENRLKKGKVVLTFDDADVSQWTTAAAYMAKYGFKGVLYPSPASTTIGANGTYFYNSAAIRTLVDKHGWQLGSQAWDTENPGSQTGEDFEKALAQLRNLHASLGCSGGFDGSWYSNVGPSSNTRYNSFRKFFRTMRAYWLGTDGTADGTPFYFMETYPFGEPMAIRAFGCDSTYSATKLQNHAIQAGNRKGVAVYVWHTFDGSVSTQAYAFFDWLDANRNLVDVVTFEELIAEEYATELKYASGTASVANGGTIAHGLGYTPAFYQLTPTVAKRLASVTASDATNLTIALHDDTGAAVTVAENVLWRAEL